MANKKITELTADTTPTSDDVIATVTDPAGTPASRKTTLANAVTKAHGLPDGVVVVTAGVMTNPTGTPTGSKFLRDDASWQSIGGGGDMLASTYDVANIAQQVVGTTATQTLTNKSIDANANTITNIETADFASGVIDTDGTLAGNSDTKIATQKATKTYVDTAVTGLLDFKGSTDTSTNPNYPSALKGDAYIVSVAGKIGGASGKSVDVGDVYLAIADNAGGTEASVGTSWAVLEHNLVGALLTANNLSDLANASTARTNLGLAIGTDVQAQGATLTSLEGLSLVAGDVLYSTGADTLQKLGVGTANQVLRVNSGATAPEWATPSSGGQTVYDYIVATSGGDYTTLGACLAVATSGSTIFVRSGTYSESAISVATTNLTIIGENPKTTILSMGVNAFTLSGASLTFMNMGINPTTGTILFSGDDLLFTNNIINTAGTTNSTRFTGTKGIIYGNRFISTATTGYKKFDFSGTKKNVYGNYFLMAGSSSFSSYGGIEFVGDHMVVSGNFIETTANTATNPIVSLGGGGAGLSMAFTNNTILCGGANPTIGIYVGNGGVAVNIVGNTLYSCGYRPINITSNYSNISGNFIYQSSNSAGDYGIYVGANNCNITGNTLYGSGTTADSGIFIGNTYDSNLVSGNAIRSYGTGIKIEGSSCDYNQIIGNNIVSSTVGIVDLGVGSIIRGNITPDTAQLSTEKQAFLMKNTSGGTLTVGTVVTLKNVAGASEFTTTTTASDPLVFGVLASASVTNNSNGMVQTLGKNISVKVDGTTDIAIGDFLTTFTTAGIAQKAVAGQTAFAIALEAYTTNDSNGVIDALLIAPRVI